MHTRNIYSQPPNFKQLAIDYPDFRQYIKIDLSGKAQLDFKNVKALSELTKTLLLKDFNLNVEIPCDKLVPTLPLRLNYILWLEDLIADLKTTTTVYGIDIGTGASCVYPLLASKNGWKMLATEAIAESAVVARRNVEANSLTELIQVKVVEDPKLVLKGVIDEEAQYTFCMCNPPFYSKKEEPKNRNRRLPPKFAHTGTDGELETDGGELEFVRRIIEDSLLLREKISIYSTMLGKKSNFKILKEELQGKGVSAVTSTEFVQGRTLRWGLAWSFNVIFTKSPSKNKKVKTKPPVTFTLSEGTLFEDAVKRLKDLITFLKMSFEIEESEPYVCNVTAFDNTWANQRKRRRALLLSTADCPEKKAKIDESGECSKVEDLEAGEKNAILEFILRIDSCEDNVAIEAELLSGSAGKEGLHQVFQFFKNNWTSDKLVPFN